MISKWLYGPEKFSGLSRNRPLRPVSRKLPVFLKDQRGEASFERHSWTAEPFSVDQLAEWTGLN